MSRKVIKYLFFLTLLAGGLSLFSVNSGRSNFYAPSNSQAEQLPQDTSTRYPVKKTQITTFDDLEESRPIDLRDPSNVKTQIEYDIKSNTYLFKTKIGDDEWITPFSMTAKEYSDYSLKQSMNSYFRQKNIETFERGDKKEDFDLKDIKINIGPAERIFGPGGVKIRPQGYVEFSMGLKRTTTENPTISEQYRSKTILDVDEKIQLNVAATVGDKVNFDLNYDTEATFDFDSKKMKLAYEGKEDEIIRYLEAGNVSLNTTNSLISGATSLFGIRADLQFGKLRVNTVISQQESESQTVGSKNGVQAMPFEFKADAYDENRHFFLGHYFRDNYDTAASQLPFIRSGITINKIEVWVTNKRGNFDQARNIIGFTDLAEGDTAHISNNRWKTGALNKLPNNNSNLLYQGIKSLDSGVRNISSTTPILEGSGLVVGQDFEKIESARLLSPNEYTINNKLGYISLNITLQSDEVLAVAYDYTLRDSTYQVGEFSSNITDKYLGDGKSGALFLKLLKPVSLTPNRYIWNLMMKNIYYLGASNIQSDRFRLNISYQSDTTGTYINYLPEGAIKNELLIKVMNLDRLNNQQKVVPGGKGDGIFDFVEGYTIRASNGRLIFPVVEPFGEHLRKKFKNDSIIANKYVFQDLYDSTLTVAQQNAERNKFKISGSYKATNNNEIDLGTMNVVRGSVKVTAGGTTLAEGTDYTVDYTSGKVYITNQSIIDAGTPVSASLESQTFFNMQRKTMLGLNLSYDFSKNFNMGATFLHMYEKPLTSKTGIGSESVKNTLVGFNLSYRTESQWLTNLIDKLPFVNATAPSQIAFDGEFAKMFPGHYKNDYAGGYSYLDDFESSRSKISLRDPYGWVLASTPSSPDHLKDDRISSDTLQYGYNRALLAWYTIDNLFTRRNSNLTPQHIKNDKDQLSNHFVREINVSELYPNRDAAYNDASTLPVLNLSYYPEQRGPYNLDVDGMSTDGKLLNPDKRWGGVIRKMDNKDFEANNVEYIEFWMMDPFVYNGTGVMPDNNGGKLYFNLGEISEDILKDGRKFYENGIPVSGDPTLTDLTAWGKVPNRQSTVYAFDKEQGDKARVIQDVGFNGLSTAEELEYRTYKNYTDRLKAKLTDDAKNRFDSDPFSPLRDPAGDNYHYYRGTDYDNNNVSILDRYKYYNNTEGNSTNNPDESYSTAAKTTPDVEDIDQDNTLNETESYYEYVVDLDPTKMNVGQSNITDKRTVKVNLANGTSSDITWYQFKIPIREPDKRIGNIRGYKSIRYMRMFLTGFEQETHLRFGTLELVRGDWRVYTRDLNDLTGNKNLITVSSVNIEENGDKQPVNYVLPPGESRILDPSQPQLRQENEQALAFQVEDLEPGVSRAIYKNTFYDLRRYKRLQMFTHVEASPDPAKGELKKGNLAIFLRLGSDYKNNYYEYEIPLTVTPHGKYNSNNPTDRLTVWPQENMFDFQLELLKNVKLNRNKKKRQAGSDVSYTKPYPEYDPTKPNNKITVMGNPSLSEINVIMVGVRNLSDADKSGEIWINELRVTDFDEEGGWAAQGNLNIALSDIGTINVSGRKETVGFGSIDQSLMERRQDDYYTYSIAANVDVGRFLPEKIKAVIPLYYAYSNETVTPKYDPLDQDVTLKESMSTVNSKAEKDSIKSLAQDKVTTKSFSLSGVKLNIRSKTPMPYDPANFTFGYAHSVNEVKNPTTVYDKTLDTKASLSYAYTPIMKTWKPFENSKSKAPMSRFLKNWGFNYLPNNISFNSNLNLHYLETEIRDLESYVLGGNNDNKTFLSFSQNYFWDRDFSLSWDFTKNLKFSIQTGTKAEIEDPFLQVNKELNPDAYDEWKKVVNKSIRKFGDPLSYRQTASLTYNAPFSEIPFLDWLTATGNYTSNYNWDKGASLEDNTNIGNSLANNVTYTINGRVNMLTLYNKWEFLKKTNQKFAQTNQRGNTATRPRAQRPTEKKARKFEQEITLKTDSVTTVKHGLNTKNLNVTARNTETNKLYKIKFKKVDNNSIQIQTKDSVKLKLVVLPGKDPEETTWYKIAQYSARGLMSLRNFSVNYSNRESSNIYGFRPQIGDFFGQSNSLVPGLGFAFGLDGGEEYLDKSLSRDWVVLDEMNIQPSYFSNAEKIDIKAQLEPFRGLKIDLTANREKENRTEIQLSPLSNGNTSRARIFGGSFSMSIVSISTAFESFNANDEYKSKTFEKFLANRDIIRNRVENKYTGARLPNGLPYTGGDVNANSADVLIPAFLAAYTGKDANSVSLSPFPSISSIVPNWTITYDGLTTLPWFKDKFKSFKLMHGYTSRYQIGSYSSFSSWQQAGNEIGFINNPLDATPGAYTPSSGFDINSVSIIEQFNPLFGAEGTLNNSMTLRARYNKGRSLNLNIASYQIIETKQNEFVVGFGYRINEFNRVIGLTSRNSGGFNNDLNITADVSYRMNQSLIRKIEERFSQATAGTTVTTIKLSADYAMSKALTLRAYFDRVINKPLVSASAYPTTNTNFGLSIRFTLTQ